MRSKGCFQLALATLLLHVSGSYVLAASPLADAAEREDWKTVESLLGEGQTSNNPQPDGTTALHWACYHDHTAVAQMLLNKGGDANAQNQFGVTPLSLACRNGNASLVKTLLDAGADPLAQLPGGESPLFIAARTGRPEPLELLLKHGAKVDESGPRSQTPLMYAAAEGHDKAVALLIEAGANPDTRSKSGFTPMLFAARNGHKAVVTKLLEAGVDVDAVTEFKSGGDAPPEGTSALRIAVENGHFELAVALLEAGADPNDQRSGFTSLHVLTWVRKPNRGDGRDGMPPPQGSGTVTSLEFARLLIGKFGADVDRPLRRGSSGSHKLGTKGATAFLMAAKTADLPYLKLLHEFGADPTIANADGTLPLMAAAGLGTHAPTEEAGTEEEALQTVAWLLELGCSVNATNDLGDTAMHGAAYKSLPKMVSYLAQQGADIQIWNQKNKRGQTPLLIAQGFRPGNFKPSADTLAAIEAVMHDQGVDPPPAPPRPSPKTGTHRRCRAP